jgi:hypothetical protein
LLVAAAVVVRLALEQALQVVVLVVIEHPQELLVAVLLLRIL